MERSEKGRVFTNADQNGPPFACTREGLCPIAARGLILRSLQRPDGRFHVYRPRKQGSNLVSRYFSQDSQGGGFCSEGCLLADHFDDIPEVPLEVAGIVPHRVG